MLLFANFYGIKSFTLNHSNYNLKKKEMMHIQLINESSYNKHHPLKIHSLCFYYRNHKHVLYGSFTINDEVFIFSFNIFDIYRSYNSKSNKKSSKSHSKATNQTNAASSSSSSSKNSNSNKTINTSSSTTSLIPASASSSSSLSSSNNNSKNNLSQQQQEPLSNKPSISDKVKPSEAGTSNNDEQSSKSDASKKVKFESIEAELAAQLPADFEFNSYMNNLVNNANSKKTEKLKHELSVESKNELNSDEDELEVVKITENEPMASDTPSAVMPMSNTGLCK